MTGQIATLERLVSKLPPGRARRRYEMVLDEALQQEPQALTNQHWVYRAWSRVLDAEVWFVHCEAEVVQLARQGVQRGSVYTEAELVELLRLPQPSSKALKDLHMVKAFFNATVVLVEESEWFQASQE